MENADLFDISMHEMPDINHTVAYHKLNVNPNAIYVYQQRRM